MLLGIDSKSLVLTKKYDHAITRFDISVSIGYKLF